VDPRNLRHRVRDDILVSLAGPASNLLIASVSTAGLMVIGYVAGSQGVGPNSFLIPLALLLRVFLAINVLLAAFNLIPIPPLDGSHVIRHLLPESGRRAYDMIGWFGILLLFFIGGPIIAIFQYPFLRFFSLFVPGL
jgi:Zn-dependent protease